MTVLSGRYGKVTSSGGDTYIKSWTLDYKADLYDSTNFDDSSGGRSYVAGFTNWSGSFEGFYSTGNTILPGDTGKTIDLRIETSTGGLVESWSGSIIIMGMGIGVGVDGLITQNYTFQGTGALSTTGT